MTKGKIFLIAAVFVGIFTFGYLTADGIWEKKYLKFKLDSEKEYSALLESKIEADQANRLRVNAVETKYVNELQEQKDVYEKTIANLRKHFTPSGVFNCTANGQCVPRTSDDTSEFVCYRRSELLYRIEKTLAIGRDAQRVNLQYKALLEIIENGKTKGN